MFTQKKYVSRLVQCSAVTAALGAAVWAYIAKIRSSCRRLVTAEQYGAAGSARRHELKVSRIARQLQDRKSTAPLSLRKAAVSHEVPKAVDNRYTDDKIDISALNEIIDIDVQNQICVAESGVTFIDLVMTTLRYGLVPIIVPEFKTITIGGAVSGCSIESMSFRYGGFHDTCLEYELITARGEVMICKPGSENELLFQMLHGSFGTLGIISRLKFRLIPAKPFVKVVYLKFATLAAYRDAIASYSKSPQVDFIDGFIHGPSEYVLNVGNFVDDAPYMSSYDWMKIYYLSTKERKEDYLRIADYLFRYDKGITNVHPKSLVGRLLLGRFVGSSELLRLAEKLHWLLQSQGDDRPRQPLPRSIHEDLQKSGPQLIQEAAAQRAHLANVSFERTPLITCRPGNFPSELAGAHCDCLPVERLADRWACDHPCPASSAVPHRSP
jgi:hypothetical protein